MQQGVLTPFDRLDGFERKIQSGPAEAGQSADMNEPSAGATSLLLPVAMLCKQHVASALFGCQAEYVQNCFTIVSPCCCGCICKLLYMFCRSNRICACCVCSIGCLPTLACMSSLKHQCQHHIWLIMHWKLFCIGLQSVRLVDSAAFLGGQIWIHIWVLPDLVHGHAEASHQRVQNSRLV